MGRRYVRDARGRFASSGYSGQTGGRGARLKAKGERTGGGAKIKASGPAGTVGKPRGLKPGAIKSKKTPPVSSARQAATDRLKIKTETRRKLRANRESVIPAKSAGPKTMKAARPGSTVGKPRTVGNTKPQVSRRVNQKLAVTTSNISRMTRYGNSLHQGTYERQLKRSLTLKRAQNYLQTGKLPGKDNSIAAQRSLRDAKSRLAAKNVARQRSAAAAKSRPKITDAKAGRIIARVDAHRPGLNKASGSLRRTQNSIRTHQRAGDFLLASSRRALKRGGSISVAESVRRAVANAKPAKAKVSRRK